MASGFVSERNSELGASGGWIMSVEFRIPDNCAVDDASEAQRFVNGLGLSRGTVGELFPRGFGANARILHPALRVPQ